MTNEVRTEICLCAICREMLFEGDELVDQRVYKCGELSYINLAHAECAPEWAPEENPVRDELECEDDEHDPFNSDAEADADVLASAGYGTDEDYGFFDHLERDHDEPYEPDCGE